jgi:hypothetical protein
MVAKSRTVTVGSWQLFSPMLTDVVEASVEPVFSMFFCLDKTELEMATSWVLREAVCLHSLGRVASSGTFPASCVYAKACGGCGQRAQPQLRKARIVYSIT